MLPNDRRQFLAGMMKLRTVFQIDASEAWLAVYWEALEDVTIEDFNAAVSKAIKESKFMPRPAELRDPSRIDVGTVWPDHEFDCAGGCSGTGRQYQRVSGKTIAVHCNRKPGWPSEEAS